MSYVVALDVGTSSCRAVLFSDSLQEISSASQEYDILAPQPGFAEQNPEEIFQAVNLVIRKALAAGGVGTSEVTGLSWAAVMHSLILLDESKKPLINAWTWADLRSSKQAQDLSQRYGQQLYEKTGCPIHPMYWPAKIRYIQQEMADVWNKARHLVSLKEYLIYRFTGELVSDQSVASATGILNIHSLQWDSDILNLLEIDPQLLSEVAEPLTQLPRLLPSIAESLGLPEDTKTVIGCSDGTLSNLGSGAVSPGVMALMVGTSGAIRMVTNQPFLHPKANTWCYYLADKHWVAGGATNNGGNVLKWFRDQMEEKKVSYATLSDYASQVPPGSNGLIFLPFLAGERCPHWNSDARGVFFGLTLTSNKKDMARAMMEGVSYQLYSIFEALSSLVGIPHEIRATGGLTQSAVWLQIMADIFGKPLAVPNSQEGSAFGAAALGFLSLGRLGRLEDVAQMITIKETIDPRMDNHRFYQDLYEQNRALYWTLSKSFHSYQDFLRRGRCQ